MSPDWYNLKQIKWWCSFKSITRLFTAFTTFVFTAQLHCSLDGCSTVTHVQSCSITIDKHAAGLCFSVINSIQQALSPWETLFCLLPSWRAKSCSFPDCSMQLCGNRPFGRTGEERENIFPYPTVSTFNLLQFFSWRMSKEKKMEGKASCANCLHRMPPPSCLQYTPGTPPPSCLDQPCYTHSTYLQRLVGLLHRLSGRLNVFGVSICDAIGCVPPPEHKFVLDGIALD